MEDAQKRKLEEELVIHLFKTLKNNTAKNIAEESNINYRRVHRILDRYLSGKSKKISIKERTTEIKDEMYQLMLRTAEKMDIDVNNIEVIDAVRFDRYGNTKAI